MKKITLTKGFEAIVDDEDYERLVWLKWHASAITPPNNAYANHTLLANGKRFRVLMHRLIIGAPPDAMVDHINGNPLDNRRSNLRLCDRYTNMANRKCSILSTTGIKGVSYEPRVKYKPWRARLRYHNKSYSLGGYATAKEAALAYDRKARELSGEFALLNYPTSR